MGSRKSASVMLRPPPGGDGMADVPRSRRSRKSASVMLRPPVPLMGRSPACHAVGMRALLLLSLLSACPEPVDDGFSDPAPCGPGTVEVDGWCVPEDAPDEACGDGTIELEGECVSAELQWVGFPLTEGDSAVLGQTFHGNFSHTDASRYAVDVPLGEGTPIAAMRSGTVVDLKEDSDTGCGTPDCANDGNFITIDHGDGTEGLYFHLEQGGAQVAVGDGVCAGEVIGFSGNTGFSTGPHLHAAVQNPFGLSLPLRFWELADANEGVPAAGQVVVSGNAEDTDCAPPPPSDCPEDLFAHLGVRLEPGVPCSLVERGRSYPVRGRASHGETVIVGTWREDPVNGGEAWSYQCVAQQADGEFEIDLMWPAWETTRGSYLAFAASNADCWSYSGWSYSARITFAP
jgi:hypothetical protein